MQRTIISKEESVWSRLMNSPLPPSEQNCNIFCNEGGIPAALKVVQERLNIPVLYSIGHGEPKWAGLSASKGATIWSITWCPYPNLYIPSKAAIVGLDIPPYTILQEIAANHEYLYFIREKEILS